MKLKDFKSKGWVVTLAGALFFFYAFFQVNLMNAINLFLQKDFNVSNAELGLAVASYFYANVLFMLPAGLLLDRFSVRKLMLGSMFLVIFSSFIFCLSESIFAIVLSRFLSGITMSFGLIICLKLASLWLDSSSMSLASSIIIAIGMIGGFISQAPVTAIAEWFGWRWSVFFVAILGGVILALIWKFVKDPEIKTEVVSHDGIFKSLSMVVAKRVNWMAALFITLLNLPIALLGAFCGTEYLTSQKGFLPLEASSIVSMLFIGMLIGSPFFGWLAHLFKKNKFLMYTGAFTCLVLVLMLLFLPLTAWESYSIMLLIGFSSAAQCLGYPIISENNEPHLVGTALSFASLNIMGLGYGVAIPALGFLISILTYPVAMITLPIGIALSIVCLMLMEKRKIAKT